MKLTKREVYETLRDHTVLTESEKQDVLDFFCVVPKITAFEKVRKQLLKRGEKATIDGTMKNMGLSRVIGGYDYSTDGKVMIWRPVDFEEGRYAPNGNRIADLDDFDIISCTKRYIYNWELLEIVPLPKQVFDGENGIEHLSCGHFRSKDIKIALQLGFRELRTISDSCCRCLYGINSQDEHILICPKHR